MADTPTPAPRTGDAPAETPIPAEASKAKPTVLATPLGEEFVIADLVGDDDKPLRITSAGVALSVTDAKRATEAAQVSRQHLITVTEKG